MPNTRLTNACDLARPQAKHTQTISRAPYARAKTKFGFFGKFYGDNFSKMKHPPLSKKLEHHIEKILLLYAAVIVQKHSL